MPTVNVNGIGLYYREAGSGEPLLLIPGTGFTADVWDKVFDALAHDYRTIAYDRRAYQRSQGSPSPVEAYSRQQGNDIAALLQAVGAIPANVVGWSAGCIYALYATLMHPNCIRQLVLYEPPLYLLRYMDFHLFQDIIKLSVFRAMGRKRALVETFVRGVLAYQDGRNSYEHLGPELRSQLAANTDIILAETAAFKKAAENVARILHNAPIIWLPESNHLAQIDQPEHFMKALNGALARKE